jgi:DNA mismatch repair protein MutL
MSKIKILPENLSNKIAAGEVVERPASVVKELIENSLDAGSRRIFVEIENGGRDLIQVADNGAGMSHDDALLSIERYATSKIIKDSDLFTVQTLGFRGEALPSIAAVSHFSLTSRISEVETGIQIDIKGGRIDRVSEVGVPVGTLISVRRLFFNTPARRKFLKTVATEMGHIVEAVSAMALGWPQVQVSLKHNHKVIKSWAKAEPAERVVDVLGAGLRPDLLALEGEANDVKVKGWVGAPRITRSTSRGIYFFVNGRFIRDRVLQHAVFSGYAGRLVKGQYPVAVIWVELPFDQVDVNVHPAKHEVRFVHQKNVHDTVANAVTNALAGAERTPWYASSHQNPDAPLPSKVAEKTPIFDSRPLRQDDIVIRSDSNQDIAQASKPSQDPSMTPRPKNQFTGLAVENKAPDIHRDLTEIDSEPQKILAVSASTKAVQNRIWEKHPFSDLKVIGQLHDTYLILEGQDGLVLIDQHAAHERIAYEKLKENMRAEKQASQRLLLPETIELGFREAQILSEMLSNFRTLGLEIEPFGGTTFVVTAVPQSLSKRQIAPLIEALVEKIADIGVGSGLEKVLDQCLMVMACHSTIRANQTLSLPEIKALLAQLDQCQQPSHCPHGRPTWIQWSLKAVQKAFNRIA